MCLFTDLWLSSLSLAFLPVLITCSICLVFDHTFSSQVLVLAVSKTKTPAMVKEVYDLGHRHFGENYVRTTSYYFLSSAKVRRIYPHCSRSPSHTLTLTHPYSCSLPAAAGPRAGERAAGQGAQVPGGRQMALHRAPTVEQGGAPCASAEPLHGRKRRLA